MAGLNVATFVRRQKWRNTVWRHIPFHGWCREFGLVRLIYLAPGIIRLDATMAST